MPFAINVPFFFRESLCFFDLTRCISKSTPKSEKLVGLGDLEVNQRFLNMRLDFLFQDVTDFFIMLFCAFDFRRAI
jgi:hypothetical protein